MKHVLKPVLLVVGAMMMGSGLQAAESAAKPEHGDYRDWPVLGISLRHDKNSLRAIVGNPVAIQAARANKVLPWPDGTVLAKIKWSEHRHPKWEQASVPGDFTAAEAMVKDSKKYAANDGWGYGIWEGKNLKMYDQAKSAECHACHQVAKESDFVFTLPNLQ